jgi:hypothetical protein
MPSSINGTLNADPIEWQKDGVISASERSSKVGQLNNEADRWGGYSVK